MNVQALEDKIQTAKTDVSNGKICLKELLYG